MALLAEDKGNQVGYMSPFALEAQKVYNDFVPRGKSDDVTVIVAQVHSKSSQELDATDDEVSVKYTAESPQGTDYSLPYYEQLQYNM